MNKYEQVVTRQKLFQISKLFYLQPGLSISTKIACQYNPIFNSLSYLSCDCKREGVSSSSSSLPSCYSSQYVSFNYGRQLFCRGASYFENPSNLYLIFNPLSVSQDSFCIFLAITTYKLFLLFFIIFLLFFYYFFIIFY